MTRDYTSNLALMSAFEDIGKRKEGVTTAIDLYASYRADLSRGWQWTVAGARFFVVTVTRQDPQSKGSVFEASDGTRFILRPAVTGDQADAFGAAAGPVTTVFAIRPNWGMPAKDWIAADPEFWKANPSSTAK